MSFWDKVFGGGKPAPVAAPERPTLPTVKFDSSRVTPEIGTVVRAYIADLSEIAPEDRAVIVKAAMLSVTRGQDLHVLATALIGVGVSKRRAGDIARNLNSRATSMMDVANAIRLGVTDAQWVWSGVPCGGSEQRVQGHQAANGQIYSLVHGMLIGGIRAWPGREDGCKCRSALQIKGF